MSNPAFKAAQLLETVNIWYDTKNRLPESTGLYRAHKENNGWILARYDTLLGWADMGGNPIQIERWTRIDDDTLKIIHLHYPQTHQHYQELDWTDGLED